MFKVFIDGRDGSLEWSQPTLIEGIALATSELKDRRAPVNASITDSLSGALVWEGSQSASGLIIKSHAEQAG